MARRQQQQNRRQRAVRRGRRAPTVTRRRGPDNRAAPPARGILSNVFRTVLQVLWDLTQSGTGDSTQYHLRALCPAHIASPTRYVGSNGSWNADIDSGWILSHGNMAFRNVFKELKVHRIDAHYMPYESTVENGLYCFTLADNDELDLTKLLGFDKKVGSPGSIVRKAYQPAHLRWFPTEADDRNWHKIGDKHVFAVTGMGNEGYVDVPTTPTTGKFSGKIITDVDVSLRGRPDTFSGITAEDYSQLIRCQCKTCSLRRRKNKILEKRALIADFDVLTVKPSDGSTAATV